MTNFINLTGSDLVVIENIYLDWSVENDVVNVKSFVVERNFLASELVAEVVYFPTHISKDNNIKVTKRQFNKVINLPEPIPGYGFIVSGAVVYELKGVRDDLYTTDGTTIRITRKGESIVADGLVQY